MGTVPPKLMPTFPRPRSQWDPKNDDPSQYSEGMTSVLDTRQCLPGGQSNVETLTLMHTIEDRICLHDLLKLWEMHAPSEYMEIIKDEWKGNEVFNELLKEKL